MNWKNRFTNYNFWISIVSAVLLILQAFEFQFDIMYINEIATAVLGLLVVIGIINDPTKTSVKVDNNVAKKENKKEVKKEISLVQEQVKDEEINENRNVESEEKVEEKIVEENLNTAEQMEENFPIAEQGKIDAEHNENDFENLIEKISADINEEENNFKEMFKNLLNLLKNNEKISKNAENSENFSNNVKNLIENNELHINKDYVVNEVENFDVTNFEDVTDIKTENNIRSTEESGMEFEQISSFNIVN